MLTYPELNRKSAIVTGAGTPGSIGDTTARALAARGVRLVCADIDAAGAEAIAASIRGAGADAIAVRTDVTSSAGVDAMVRAALDRLSEGSHATTRG